MDESVAEIASDLVNLDGLSLAAMDSYEDAIFTSALAPLLGQIEDPTSSVAGHNS
jgi:hypothetical protein